MKNHASTKKCLQPEGAFRKREERNQKGYGKPETCPTNQTQKGNKNFRIRRPKQPTPHTLPQMRKNNHTLTISRNRRLLALNNEEALLLAKFLRNERKKWIPRIPTINARIAVC